MLDTHAVARSLTAADFTPAQADALTDALRSAVEQGYRPDSCGNTRYVPRRRPSIRMFSLIAHEGDAGLGKER